MAGFINLREAVLKKHKKQRHHSKTRTVRLVNVPDKVAAKDKTRLMQLLELKHGQRIEEILCSGSQLYIQKKYKVDQSTVSKWQKRLGLNKAGNCVLMGVECFFKGNWQYCPTRMKMTERPDDGCVVLEKMI